MSNVVRFQPYQKPSNEASKSYFNAVGTSDKRAVKALQTAAYRVAGVAVRAFELLKTGLVLIANGFIHLANKVVSPTQAQKQASERRFVLVKTPQTKAPVKASDDINLGTKSSIRKSTPEKVSKDDTCVPTTTREALFERRIVLASPVQEKTETTSSDEVTPAVTEQKVDSNFRNYFLGTLALVATTVVGAMSAYYVTAVESN